MLFCAGPHPWERQAGDGNASIGHHQEKAMSDSAIPSSFSILISGLSFLESPRWRAGRLWLSDFYTHQVIACDMVGRVEKIAELPHQPSGLGWLPDGRLLVVSMRDRKLMRREAHGRLLVVSMRDRKLMRREADGRLLVHADLSALAGGHANDMAVDRHGNAYVGNFGFDLMGGGPVRSAQLARVAPDGQVVAVAYDLRFPNGIVITPDGQTLIVAETLGNRLSAFATADDGSMGARADWAKFGPLPEGSDLQAVKEQIEVAPDGVALDDAGAVWLADAIGPRVLRVARGGRVLQEVSTGRAMRAYASALGGPDGRTLFLCVAPDSDEQARKAAREAAVWYLPVNVAGGGGGGGGGGVGGVGGGVGGGGFGAAGRGGARRRAPGSAGQPRRQRPARMAALAHQFLRHRGGDDAPALLAALGAEVDDPVGLGDHVQVMLYDHHAVAGIDQAVQHADQLVDIGHVQAHRGFVQHVEGVRRFLPPAGDVVAHLAQFGHQFDALRLAPAERGRGLAECQITQAHVLQ